MRERRYTALQVRAAAHRILATARGGKQLSASTAALEQGAPAMRCTLSRLMERVWARGGAASYSEAWLARSDLIDAFQFKTKGNPAFRDRVFLSADDDSLIKDACTLSSAGGFGLDSIAVRDMMNEHIQIAQITDQNTGRLFAPTLTYVRKWMKRNKVHGYKSSGLDKQRAVKATKTIRDAWFGLVEGYVRDLYNRGLIPWATYDDIPDKCKYNFDEEAANTSMGRRRILSAKRADDGMRRLFDVSSDGRMSRHVTDGMTTRADGKVCPPYVIKARGSGKDHAAKRRAGEPVPVLAPTDKDAANLTDKGSDDDHTLNIGLGISPNGSMTLELFPLFCEHFSAHPAPHPAPLSKGTLSRVCTRFSPPDCH